MNTQTRPTIPGDDDLNTMPDQELATLSRAYGLPAMDRAADTAQLIGLRDGTIPPIPDDAELDKLDADQIADLLKAHAIGGLSTREADLKQLRDRRDPAQPREPGQAGVGTAGGALGEGHAGSMAGTGAGPGDQDPPHGDPLPEAGFEFELGAKVFLFERNHDATTGKLLDGYQAGKPGKIVKINEDSSRIDLQTGGEDGPSETSHDVPHQSQASDGENYWSDRAE